MEKLVATISGRLLPWHMTNVVYPWVGGNYYQLDEMIRTGQLGPMDEVMRNLRDAVRDADAGAVHIADLADYAKGRAGLSRYTALVISVADIDTRALLAQEPDSAWADFGTHYVERDASPGAEIRFQQRKDTMQVGGLRAYSAVFHIDHDEIGAWCRGAVMIPLGRRRTHIFTLSVAQARWQDRYLELEEMLDSLTYDPRLVDEVLN